MCIISCNDFDISNGGSQGVALTILVSSATEPSLPILALGHGIFGSRARTACTVTSGVVSKVVQYRGEPVMIVSSAKVHRGCSGGVLVDAERPGRVVGLISSE